MGGLRKYRPVIAESRANSEWRMANSGGRIGYSIRYSLFAIRYSLFAPSRTRAMIQSTMQKVPLSLNQILERAGRPYPQSQIVSRLPDKSLKRHTFAEFYTRARRLAAALLKLGLNKGDRVATLSWNHYAHLECYFGIPAAGGVM